MFLLVSVRHVGAHPGELQHGVSIQISISLGKTFLRISCIRNIPLTWILARVFVYVPPFISQILDLIYWTVLIFILNGVTLKTSNTCSWQTNRMTNYNWFIDLKLPDWMIQWERTWTEYLNNDSWSATDRMTDGSTVCLIHLKRERMSWLTHWNVL